MVSEWGRVGAKLSLSRLQVYGTSGTVALMIGTPSDRVSQSEPAGHAGRRLVLPSREVHRCCGTASLKARYLANRGGTDCASGYVCPGASSGPTGPTPVNQGPFRAQRGT